MGFVIQMNTIHYPVTCVNDVVATFGSVTATLSFFKSLSKYPYLVFVFTIFLLRTEHLTVFEGDCEVSLHSSSRHSSNSVLC